MKKVNISLIYISLLVFIISLPLSIEKFSHYITKTKNPYGNHKLININKIYSNNNYVTTKNTVIYYIPHPDDETLSMGVPILNDLKNKKNVQMVLFTAGEDSGAINNINSKINRYHFIFRKYHIIDRKDMANARLVEFMRASLTLGIKPENLHFEDFRSGKLTETECEQTMLKYEKIFPDSAGRTTSTFDVNPDHRHLGQALFKLHKKGIIKDAAFFLSPEEWNKTIYGKINNIPIAINMKNIGIPIKNNSSNLNLAFMSALNSYKLWDPTDTDYAIGYNSVKDYFDSVIHLKISMLVPIKYIKVMDEGPIKVPPYRTYAENTTVTTLNNMITIIKTLNHLWLIL